MGFNTTVVVLNDALDQIENDPEFGKTLVAAILGLSIPSRPRDVPAGNHTNAATVIETHHADSMHVVAVGGNLGRDLGYAGNYRLWDDPESMLRILADELGYDLQPRSVDPDPIAERNANERYGEIE